MQKKKSNFNLKNNLKSQVNYLNCSILSPVGQLWVRVAGLLFILRQLLLLFYFSDYIVSFAEPFRLSKLINPITDI